MDVPSFQKDIAVTIKDSNNASGTENSNLSTVDGWEIAKQATALRKGGHSKDAVKLARHGLEQLPEFEPLRSALCWALYQRDVKGLSEEPTIDELRVGWKTCQELKVLLTSELYGEFSAWTISVLRIASGMLNYANGDTTQMIKLAREMLLEIENSRLSREGYKNRPSLAERHALGLTKAYQKLHEWQPLRAACEEFIGMLSPRGDTELWLRHRLGIACLELDDAPTAEPHLQFVLRRKPGEWWAMFNHGRALVRVGQNADAIKAFANALKGRNLHMKTSVMLELASLLRSQGRNDDANRHHLVARQVRMEKGWPSTPEIDACLKDGAESTPEDLQKLKQLWDELTPEQRDSGTIITVFENGGAGFVDTDDGDRIYFAMKRDQLAPGEGSRVTFRIVDSFDKKKNKTSKKAIDIRKAGN